MSRIHANNFSTTINGAITNVATTVVLTSVTGFPTIGAGVTCNLTLQSGSTIEIVTATARSTNTLTIIRAQEGTSAVAWADLSVISIRPTADSVDRKQDLLDALSVSTVTPAASDVFFMQDASAGYALKGVLYSAIAAGGGGGLVDGDYGDVSVSGSGTTITIDNDVVTYAKMQNVSATDKILGRSTAGAGDVEEIDCTAAGRAVLSAANAAAQRTALGLGTLATQSGTFSGTSSGTNTGDQNLFSTIAVSGQSNVVADTTSDTLTLIAGTNVTITTNATNDEVTINASGGGGGGGMTVVQTSSASISATTNTIYVCSNATLATVTLPASFSVGDIVKVTSNGNGPIKITANTGQAIALLGVIGSVAGSITCASGYDRIQVSAQDGSNWGVDFFCSTLLTTT